MVRVEPRSPGSAVRPAGVVCRWRRIETPVRRRNPLRRPKNVDRCTHLPPGKHRRFYNSQRFTLNVTRASMVAAGYSPSVRLFEAAACATPIVSDYWPGLETFFKVGSEILVASGADDVLGFLREM